jgi:hypothetical protein
MTFALRYAVGKGGWAAGGYWLDPGTVVDTSQGRWFEDIWRQPPPDAVPLDQFTYDYFVSRGMIGMSYPYERVAVVAGVVGILPQRGSGLSGYG